MEFGRVVFRVAYIFGGMVLTNTHFHAPPRALGNIDVVQRDCFWVKHYAGKVKYTIGGWVERNMDSIPQSFNDTLATSTLKVTVVQGKERRKEGRKYTGNFLSSLGIDRVMRR